MSRAAKVARIAQAVRDGTYKIQVEWLADTLLYEPHDVPRPPLPFNNKADGNQTVSLRHAVRSAEVGDNLNFEGDD